MHARTTSDTTRRPSALVLTDETLSLPGDLRENGTFDVLLNGQYVWSVQPERDTRARGGHLVARWPRALHAHLVGMAEVTVRDHDTGEVVAEGSHSFGGESDRRVSVTDKHGRPLVLDKYNRLVKPMSGQSPEVLDQVLDGTLRVLETLRDEAGVPAFVCYGTLLGAVRDGRVIGHDNDIDIAYLSRHHHPADVMREGFRIERILRERQFVVRRGSGARLNVRISVADGSVRYVDIFTACYVEDVLYMQADTGFRLPVDTILPLGTVTLHGREAPGPAQPERLLEATYGPGWRTPDPSFKYETPLWLKRRLNGWFGGLTYHRKQWDSFYAKSWSQVPRQPSDFARWVAAEYPSSRPLVDVGSGTGRDSLWFARRHRRRVTGLDYSIGAVARSRRLSRARDLPAEFEVFNLYDTRAVLARGAQLSRARVPADLYARFTLHALEADAQVNLIRLASMSLRRGGLLFLEFRTDRDRDRPHTFGEHARTYLRPKDVATMVREAGGRVIHRQIGVGQAILRDEDPHVCRMVATWSDVAPKPQSKTAGLRR